MRRAPSHRLFKTGCALSVALPAAARPMVAGCEDGLVLDLLGAGEVFVVDGVPPPPDYPSPRVWAALSDVDLRMNAAARLDAFQASGLAANDEGAVHAAK